MRWLATFSIGILMYAMLPAITHGSEMMRPLDHARADAGMYSSIGDDAHRWAESVTYSGVDLARAFLQHLGR